MANITVQLSVGTGEQASTIAREQNVVSISKAIEVEGMLRKQYSAIKNANTAISVVLMGEETKEQLNEVATKLGKAVYGPFVSKKSGITRYLIGNPKGEGLKSTGSLA